MKKRIWIIVGVILGLAFVGWALFGRGQGSGEKEYRYGKAEKGELIRSSSATGILVPLTQVDIKSKAGGEVIKLYVEEGSVVKAGDKIAEIDPRDTQASFDQAAADMDAAKARVDAAVKQTQITERSYQNSVNQSRERLAQAQVALQKSRLQSGSQPVVSRAALDTARASLNASLEAQKQVLNVDVPQQRREAASQLSSAQAALDAAQADYTRQQGLLEKGYVPGSAVERALSALQAAQANFTTASERKRTIETAISTQIRTAQTRVAQSQAALREAQANQNQIPLAEQNVRDAEAALKLAEANLRQAQDTRLNAESSQIDVRTAKSQMVRNKVTLSNAKVQLDSTTVLSPRAGTVTTKYLEQGTIIPPGTSTFSQGTSIVQLADTTRMFIECTVDEADISTVKQGQAVKIVVEGYPGQKFDGEVVKIFPAAVTANSITTVKTRVEFKDLASVDQKKFPMRPGMNATCEFLLLDEKDVTMVPSQAVQSDKEGDFVMVKTGDPKKPVRKTVKVGRKGNDSTEILEGVKEGDEVVIATIDLADLRDRQQKMQQQQQGGGLGASQNRAPATSRGGNGSAGAGAGGRKGG